MNDKWRPYLIEVTRSALEIRNYLEPLGNFIDFSKLKRPVFMANDIEEILNLVKERDDISTEQLLEIARLSANTSSAMTKNANDRLTERWNIVPWAGLVGLISAVSVAWLNGNFTIQESHSNNNHQLRSSELAYMQTFASGLFEAEGSTAKEIQLEQRRKICTSAKLGTLRIPEYLLVDHAKKVNPLVEYLNAEFKCHDLGEISLPESAPTGPESSWINGIPMSGALNAFGNLDVETITHWANTLSPDQMIENLTSNDSGVRRGARASLIRAGISVVPSMLGQLRIDPDSYRMLLGTSVVLNGIAESNSSIIASLRNLISDNDLVLFVGAVTHSDKVLRQNTTQILSTLDDGRIPERALAVWEETDSGNLNGLYNLAYLIDVSAQFVSHSEKEVMISEIFEIAEVAGPRTRGLLEKAIKTLERLEE